MGFLSLLGVGGAGGAGGLPYVPSSFRGKRPPFGGLAGADFLLAAFSYSPISSEGIIYLGAGIDFVRRGSGFGLGFLGGI